MLPVGQIIPNPHQPRRTFNEATLAELAASIKSTGLIQPIVVRPADQGYELVAGERRWRAAKLAGLTEVAALVRRVDALSQAQMALVENIHREDLNPMDRALAYKTLLDQLGLTQNELADRLGEDRSKIANYLRLMDLGEPARQMLRDGLLSMGHAKVLAGVADVLEQSRLAELVRKQDLSVRNIERIIQGSPTPSAAPTAPASPAHYASLEQSLTRQLGMRVQVRAVGKRARGRLVIHYSNLDQFDALMEKLSLRPNET